MEKKKKLYEEICKIIDSHVVTVYVTPMTIKRYIPNENIPKLKSDIKKLYN